MNKYFYIFFVLFLPLHLSAQQNKMLNKELQEALQSEKLTGAVWSMVSDGKITTGALGIKNTESKELLNSKNSVQVGSVAKVLMATGILRLASQDKLDVDTPIIKILPNIIFDNLHGFTYCHGLNMLDFGKYLVQNLLQMRLLNQFFSKILLC